MTTQLLSAKCKGARKKAKRQGTEKSHLVASILWRQELRVACPDMCGTKWKLSEKSKSYLFKFARAERSATITAILAET